MVMRSNRLREGKDKDWDFMDDIKMDINEILKGVDETGDKSTLQDFIDSGDIQSLRSYIISVGSYAFDSGTDSGWENASYEMYSQEDADEKYDEGHEDGEEVGEAYGYERGYEEAELEYEGKYEEGKKDAYEKLWRKAHKEGYQAGEDRGYTDYLETVDKSVDYGYDDEDFDEHQ